MRDGAVRLAAYDFRRRRLKEFALAPRFPAVQPDPDWVWLDNRRLAVAVHLSGEGPLQLTFRRSIGKHLTERWAKSWEGKEASVFRNVIFASDTIPPTPGCLVKV